MTDELGAESFGAPEHTERVLALAKESHGEYVVDVSGQLASRPYARFEPGVGWAIKHVGTDGGTTHHGCDEAEVRALARSARVVQLRHWRQTPFDGREQDRVAVEPDVLATLLDWIDWDPALDATTSDQPIDEAVAAARDALARTTLDTEIDPDTDP